MCIKIATIWGQCLPLQITFNHIFIKLSLWIKDKQQQHSISMIRQIIECIGYILSIKVLSSLVNLTLFYKDLRKYADRFYTYYRMCTEQFSYILAQIEHSIYKTNTNWWHSISAEEKLAICIRDLYLLNYFC